MSFVHGKNTYFSINAKDLSAYTTTSQLEQTSDSHDVTTYGKNSHVFNSGLKNGTASASGIYDNTAVNGPRAVLKALIGAGEVELIRRPEGTGTGKPQDTVNVIVLKYVETNPVADMVTWSVDLQLSGDLVPSTQ